jgi:prepilin-type N-terminal cleavage/methylation domain-containing protein
MRKDNPQNGFTLLELIVSMALGLIVMASLASLFKLGLNSTMLVTQRAETQQNMRAAVDIMVKDISLAGAGLPSGGIQLPSGAGSSVSKFACDQGGTCHIPTHSYPTGNYMYGIIPGFSNGVEAAAVIPAAPAPAINDSITVIYADYNFPMWEFDLRFTSATSGVNMTVAPNASFAPAPPAITSAAGIKTGDLLMIAGGGITAVGEVTALTNTTLTFANLDPLNINQDGATSGNLKAIAAAVGTAQAVTAYRLFAVTYYLTVPGAGQTPRLMRQVNGLSPVPVADDIINLQLAYDTYNSLNSALDANQADPLGALESPNNIQKVNLIVMGQSIVSNGNKAQNMYLATSVSARNMTFRDRYQ